MIYKPVFFIITRVGLVLGILIGIYFGIDYVYITGDNKYLWESKKNGNH